jgi:hypothetical protein
MNTWTQRITYGEKIKPGKQKTEQNNQKLPTWQEFQNELRVRVLKEESFRKEAASQSQGSDGEGTG